MLRFLGKKVKGSFLLGIALYALLAPHVLAGISLCIDNHGGVVFEPFMENCCENSGAGSEEAQAKPSGACEECIDIALSPDPKIAALSRSLTLNGSESEFPLQVGIRYLPPNDPLIQMAFMPLTHPARDLSVQRSVVLRI